MCELSLKRIYLCTLPKVNPTKNKTNDALTDALSYLYTGMFFLLCNCQANQYCTLILPNSLTNQSIVAAVDTSDRARRRHRRSGEHCINRLLLRLLPRSQVNGNRSCPRRLCLLPVKRALLLQAINVEASACARLVKDEEE